MLVCLIGVRFKQDSAWRQFCYAQIFNKWRFCELCSLSPAVLTGRARGRWKERGEGECVWSAADLLGLEPGVYTDREREATSSVLHTPSGLISCETDAFLALHVVLSYLQQTCFPVYLEAKRRQWLGNGSPACL